MKAWWARLGTTKQTLLVAGVIVLLLILATSGSGGSSSSQQATAPTGNPNRPNEAKGDYAPRVRGGQPVTVDGLVYEVENARTARSIPDPHSESRLTADGVFVILRVRVHSDKADDITFSNNARLKAGGETYDPDDDATLVTDEGLDSHATVTGNLVFDVPDTAVLAQPELKLTELGLGGTEGYIALRALDGPTTVPTTVHGVSDAETPAVAGVIGYRYGDSNPGFRRERAAS